MDEHEREIEFWAIFFSIVSTKFRGQLSWFDLICHLDCVLRFQEKMLSDIIKDFSIYIYINNTRAGCSRFLGLCLHAFSHVFLCFPGQSASNPVWPDSLQNVSHSFLMANAAAVDLDASASDSWEMDSDLNETRVPTDVTCDGEDSDESSSGGPPPPNPEPESTRLPSSSLTGVTHLHIHVHKPHLKGKKHHHAKDAAPENAQCPSSCQCVAPLINITVQHIYGGLVQPQHASPASLAPVIVTTHSGGSAQRPPLLQRRNAAFFKWGLWVWNLLTADIFSMWSCTEVCCSTASSCLIQFAVPAVGKCCCVWILALKPGSQGIVVTVALVSSVQQTLLFGEKMRKG